MFCYFSLCPAATAVVIAAASENNPALSLSTLFLSGLGKQTTSSVKDWTLRKSDKGLSERD